MFLGWQEYSIWLYLIPSRTIFHTVMSIGYTSNIIKIKSCILTNLLQAIQGNWKTCWLRCGGIFCAGTEDFAVGQRRHVQRTRPQAGIPSAQRYPSRRKSQDQNHCHLHCNYVHTSSRGRIMNPLLTHNTPHLLYVGYLVPVLGVIHLTLTTSYEFTL